MPRTLVLLAVGLLVTLPIGMRAQDVEMLGERYGTPVPDGYRRMRAGDPGAFEFERAWVARGVGEAMLAPYMATGAAAIRGAPLPLGPRDGPVQGTFEIPVVLGLFSNSGSQPPFSRDTIQEAYFGAVGQTITDYYEEVSGGLVTLRGDVLDWVQTDRPDTAYTVGESGLVGDSLGGGGTGNFIVDLLDRIPPVDWGLYDSDGPDGIPNSGDDDGFVDLLALVQPTRGGECGGSGSENRIWSHRWSLSSATSGMPHTTATPAAGGGLIRINDYTVQPAVACSGGGLSQIGVFTHELGHAFGLPDLYDPDLIHAGAGAWDLMSSGSWGCNNVSPQTPCHMGAWSKAALGWVDVITLAPDTDHGTLVVDPVQGSGTVYRVDAVDGSGEYFLVENRQREGYDLELFAEGLLIWQIDPALIERKWPANRVNAGEHMGVWLRQADGLGDLQAGSGRGDAGDPFPGQSGNRAFHSITEPSALSWPGAETGFTLFDIVPAGDQINLHVVTGFSEVTVRADGAASSDDLFTVNGVPVSPPATTFLSSPFVEHAIVAASGEFTGPGVRTPFLSWADDADAMRARTIITSVTDVEYVANYSGIEYELALTLTGGVAGVEPALFSSMPVRKDLWFGPGGAVTLEAVPVTGFEFLSWSGALAGQLNPAVFTMAGPLTAGADFALTYVVPETTLELPSGTHLEVQLEVANGTAPIRWTLVDGTLPDGLALSIEGEIRGAALDLGLVPLTFDAVDANGLPSTGVITLDLVPPLIPIEQLVQQFLLVGEGLNSAQISLLNRQGNGIGAYDLGDFRAWVLGNPVLSLSANFSAVHRETLVIPMGPKNRKW